MSKDIRSFFSVLSTKKSTNTSSTTSANKSKKRPVIESSDEDVIPDTPKEKKTEKSKKRKTHVLKSDSDDEIKPQKKQTKRESKETSSKTLKPIDISNSFSSTPIKQAPVPEKKLKPVVTPEDTKKSKGKKGDKSRQKGLQTELGIHNDKDFEKSLLDLDEDFLLASVDELDKSINTAVRSKKEKKVEENNKKLPKSPKKEEDSSINTNGLVEIAKTPKTPNAPRPNKEDDHYDGDPDQDRYERKRQSAMLYQKYLNRSGPAHRGSKELPKGTPTCLSNLCFLRTGVLDSIDKDEFETLIKDHGGRVVSGISKKVHYVVVGEEPGPAKLEKAKNYGIKLISEDELLDLIRTKSGMAPKNTELDDDSTKIEETPEKPSSKKSIPEEKTSHKKAKLEEKTTPKKTNLEEKSIPKKTKLEEKTSPNKTKTEEKTTPKIANSTEKVSSKASEYQDLVNGKSETVTKIEPKTVKPLIATKTTERRIEPSSVTKTEDDNNNNLSWAEKYRPTSVKSIIGQQTEKSNMKKLLFWLENWFKNHGGKNKPKLVKPSPWAKSDDGAYFKTALLSGPPGIGKTTTATLVAKELGFDVVEFNASDTRSKRLLHEEVSQLLSTKSLAGYFNEGAAPSRKHVLLMDEVDGMAGNEDRGGVQELISLIKNSNVPIICMCNDRNHPKIRSLSNYCFDLRFSRPRMEQIKGAMMSVCFKEGIKIKPDTLTEIINSAGMDIRQVLTHLSLWTSEQQTGESSEIKGPKKDSPLGTWEVCRKVFSAEEHKSASIVDREKLFYYDYSIAPLFVQENYLSVMPHAPKNQHLKLFAAAANSISMGDVVDSKLRQSNNWSLLNVEAMCMSVFPGSYLSGHMNGRIDFPSWLGKNSKKNKFTRLLGELQAHMRTSISGNRSEVNLDYITPLRRDISAPLAKKGADGVVEALGVMHAYNLLREDLDSILEIGQWPRQTDPMSMVDSKVKAAFTRSYNKSSAKLPYAVHSNISKKRGTATNDEGYGLSEEEDAAEENSDDERDVTKDAMIKAKKAPSKTSKKDDASASTSKKGAKASTSRPAKKIKK